MSRLGATLLAGALALAVIAPLPPVSAQSTRDTARKLEELKRELEQVAAQRRRIEDQRGEASRKLRAADERVGSAVRELRGIEQQLDDSEQQLRQLQQRRDELQSNLDARRTELAELLRAAYRQGDAAPLKLLLAQDRVADANRLLTYHRYLQRDRAGRIDRLGGELQELDTLQQAIVERRAQLEAAREQQSAQLAQVKDSRAERAGLVAQLDRRYRDQRAREKALGRDAQGLEKLLAKLRAAAAKAEAERRAAAERAAREAREAGKPPPKPAPPAGTGIKVGGAGWPLSGERLAGFGDTLPGGHESEGLLIAAAAGSPVKAVADGQVVYAEWMTGYGLLLIVDHGGGTMSLYAHNDALLHGAGDRVTRGQPVATVGSSGGRGRPALYFELRRDGKPVDPEAWLER